MSRYAATQAFYALSPKARYNKLVADIEAIELTHNKAYLLDDVVSYQNSSFYNMVSLNEMDEEHYAEMTQIAGSEAGSRAAELGLDLNNLLGYNVY